MSHEVTGTRKMRKGGEQFRRKKCKGKKRVAKQYDHDRYITSIKLQIVAYTRVVFNWDKWVNIERNLIQFPHIRSLYGAYIIGGLVYFAY